MVLATWWVLSIWPVMDVSGATKLYFPQVADGGGYKTTFLLTNPSSTTTTAQIEFLQDSGQPWTVTIGSTTASTFSFSLPASGALKAQTAGRGTNTSSGWVRVTTNPGIDINGNAVFQLYTAGKLAGEASVPGAEALKAADFFADEEGFHTGFAMANPESIAAKGSVLLFNTQGSQVGSSAFSLAPNQHAAKFLFELMSNAASGRAEIRLNEGSIAVTALRYDSSFSVFSTLGVTSLSTGGATLPVIISLNPTRVKPGQGVFTLIVAGNRFHSMSSVYWNSGELAVSARDLTSTPQTLSATVPQALTATATTAVIKVINPAGSTNEGTSNSVNLIVSQYPYP